MSIHSISASGLETPGARSRGFWRSVLLVLCAIVLGILLSVALVYGSVAVALVALGALFWVIVVVDRPEFGIATLLFLTSGFVSQDSLPALHLGGNFRPTDLVLGFLLLLVLCKPAVKKAVDFIHTPLDLPMLLWALAAVVACFTAVGSGVAFISAVPEARNVLYYLAFFAVTNLVRDEKSLNWLVKALFGIAILTSVALIAQAAVGPTVHLIPGFVYEVNIGTVDFTGVNRVEAPGSILIQCLTVGGLVVWMLRRAPAALPVYAGAMALLVVATILPFYRSLWISFLIPIGLAFLVVPKARQARILLLGLIVLPLLLALGALLLTMPGSVGNYARALVARGDSLTTGSAFTNQQDTWADRLQEVVDGIPVVETYPIFGVGYAVPWRSGGRFFNDVGTFTHNGYLWILVKMGLLGFLPFLWLIIAFVVRGVRNWKRVSHPFYQALALGSTLAICGLLISNVAEPRFVENWTWTTALAVLMGINEVIYRLYGMPKAPALAQEAPVE